METSPRKKTCFTEQQFIDWLLHNLPDHEALLLSEHLSQCPACHALADEWSMTLKGAPLGYLGDSQNVMSETGNSESRDVKGELRNVLSESRNVKADTGNVINQSRNVTGETKNKVSGPGNVKDESRNIINDSGNNEIDMIEETLEANVWYRAASNRVKQRLWNEIRREKRTVWNKVRTELVSKLTTILEIKIKTKPEPNPGIDYTANNEIDDRTIKESDFRINKELVSRKDHETADGVTHETNAANPKKGRKTWRLSPQHIALLGVATIFAVFLLILKGLPSQSDIEHHTFNEIVEPGQSFSTLTEDELWSSLSSYTGMDRSTSQDMIWIHPQTIHYAGLTSPRAEGDGYVWFNPETEELLIVVQDIPDDYDQDYQAWIIEEQSWIDVGLLKLDNGSGHLYKKTKGLKEAETVRLSIEPKGGSLYPTGPDFFFIQLRSN